MKKLALLLALLPCPLFGQTVPKTSGQHRTSQVISRAPNGGVTAQVVPNATIAVTNTATGLAGAIYFDPLLTVPVPNSTLTADASGNYGYYFGLGLCMTEKITYPGSAPVIIPNICSNGGGQGTVTSFAVGTWPSWLTPSVTNATSTPTLAVTASAIPYSAFTTINADSVLMNASASTAVPAGVALPSGCAAGINYSNVTHTFSCVTAGGVTTTGSPVSGNLAVFSGASSITNGDLSGDCTTSGTLTVSCTKLNGGTVPASAKVLGSNGSNQFVSTPVQGTDANILTSGTVSGTGSLLCTDGNGGATTSGCPTIFTNPMTTSGDTIYGGVSGTPTRLGIGTTGQWMTVAGGVPTWSGNPATLSSGYLVLPGGMIIETGLADSATASKVVTFPLTFPHALLSVSFGTGNYDTNASRNVCYIAPAPTTSGMTVNTDASTVHCFWTAIGW